MKKDNKTTATATATATAIATAKQARESITCGAFVYAYPTDSDAVLYDKLVKSENNTKQAYIDFVVTLRDRYGNKSADTIRKKLESAGVTCKVRKSEFVALILKSKQFTTADFLQLLAYNSKKEVLSFLRGGNYTLDGNGVLRKKESSGTNKNKTTASDTTASDTTASDTTASDTSKLDLNKLSDARIDDLVEAIQYRIDNNGLKLDGYTSAALFDMLDVLKNAVASIQRVYDIEVKKAVAKQKAA